MYVCCQHVSFLSVMRHLQTEELHGRECAIVHDRSLLVVVRLFYVVVSQLLLVKMSKCCVYGILYHPHCTTRKTEKISNN